MEALVLVFLAVDPPTGAALFNPWINSSLTLSPNTLTGTFVAKIDLSEWTFGRLVLDFENIASLDLETLVLVLEALLLDFPLLVVFEIFFLDALLCLVAAFFVAFVALALYLLDVSSLP